MRMLLIFFLHNSKKMISNDTSLQNYYRIIAKDIGVKDSFQDIVCKIVNDIEVTISIKFKNKFSSGSISVKDRLKFFNQSVNSQKKANENQYIPKKLAMPNFLNKVPQDNQKQPNKKTIEETKMIKKNSNVFSLVGNILDIKDFLLCHI